MKKFALLLVALSLGLYSVGCTKTETAPATPSGDAATHTEGDGHTHDATTPGEGTAPAEGTPAPAEGTPAPAEGTPAPAEGAAAPAGETPKP